MFKDEPEYKPVRVLIQSFENTKCWQCLYLLVMSGTQNGLDSTLTKYIYIFLGFFLNVTHFGDYVNEYLCFKDE